MDRCWGLFFRMSGKLSDTGKLTDLGIPTETEELGLSETPPNPSEKELLIKGFCFNKFGKCLRINAVVHTSKTVRM